MVSLTIFGEGVGVPFPRFDLKRDEGQSTDDFVTTVEEEARDILSEMSDKEYLAWRDIAGMMPHLNRLIEELGIHHE